MSGCWKLPDDRTAKNTMHCYRYLMAVFLLLCVSAGTAAADWVELEADDRETVRDAIAQEVHKRGDFDNAVRVKEARKEAIDEAHRKSQAVVERVDELRRSYMQIKTKRDDQQAEFERLTRRKDDAENNYKGAVDLMQRLDAQLAHLQQEIAGQGEQLKEQLANEAVGELLTAVVFKRTGLQGARLSELEAEASRRAGEAAIAEMLTYIESTSLIEEGVLTRDQIVQRISGRAESEPGKVYREKIGRGTYLRLLTFRLKPLQGSLLKAKSGLPATGMPVAVIRKAEDLPRFLQAQGFNVSANTSAQVERLLEESKRATEKDQANVEGILRRTREVVKQRQEAVREITAERSEAEARRDRNEKRMQEAARGVSEVRQRLRETNTVLQEAAREYEQAVGAYRKYKFKQAKGIIERHEQPADAAIEVILNALQEVRDDARRHYYDALTRVHGGRFVDERIDRKAVAARISRFKLIYLTEAQLSDELEIGILFETMAAQKEELQETEDSSQSPASLSVTEPEMVVLSAGCFQMGSPMSEQGREERERLHRVCVEEFEMSRHELTVAAYRQFVEDTGYRTEAQRSGGCSLWNGAWKTDRSASWMNPGFEQQPDHPVVCVSYNDARAYADWLSKHSARRYRLPTETEWEYAARGGTTSARFWGEGPQQACVFANAADHSFAGVHRVPWRVHDCRDSFVATSPAGRFRANAMGLKDMLGNVWEWTCSSYDEAYSGGEGRCAGESASSRHVIRGGAWLTRPQRLRSASRHHARASHRSSSIGFRLVRE